MGRFSEAGVNSLMDPAAMSVLRETGGYTKMLSETLEDYLKTETSNPRFLQFRDDLLRTLKMKLPQMRATLQELLAAHKWSSEFSSSSHGDKPSSESPKSEHLARTPLRLGTHVEVELQDASARWKGRPDVLALSVKGCEITDFKTGKPDDEHQRQMWVYAMLWTKDSERNPTNSPVLKMSLVYTSGSTVVAVPSEAGMEAFRAQLVEKSRELKLALNSEEVPAYPSIENCRYCQVQLLCDAYWKNLSAFEPREHFSGAELVLIEARGERSWLATVKSSQNLEANERVVLRSFQTGNAFWKDLRPGLSVRITDAVLSSAQTEDIPLLNLSMLSEALFLD
jgi:hypothetical protein